MSESLRTLLRAYRSGELDEDDVVRRLDHEPYEDHVLGRLDHRREDRTGIPEVVLAEGKKAPELVDLFRHYRERDEQLIATRVPDDVRQRLSRLDSPPVFFEDARVAAVKPPEPDESRTDVLVLSAGASDRPTAREAVASSRLLGNPTGFVEDVGVAGINRLAPDLSRLDEAGILIVVAGMDGVLPSLVGGLARQPVIAVPTSVGYGTAFEGVSALLTMLNSCVPGTAVMNIDNGFGAAVLATKINQLVARAGP